ncbi:MAG: phosphoribosylamine--glycine ligase [Acidobacteria bacterium]|nr:MAG: phosphoribosylamine--glycine ligase [Acidobacteriota bacterium]PIE89688.1 MAG: phosphoribosylamine--glycine ligase [Acidobacteriota bacterium]
MNILILGSGGREHALGWKISQSPLLGKLYFAPGNPGTLAYGQNINLKNNAEVVDFAVNNQIDLVIPGPEAWLMRGIVDDLEKKGVRAFGPTKQAAMLEGSKAFAKEMMDKAGVPTASHKTFTQIDDVMDHFKQAAFPLVVKADGLAAGKGVTICFTEEQAITAATEAMVDKKFGSSGNKLIIEEYLTGTEASFHLICDGKRATSLVSAQDHKALYEDNKGPNTGGMGTFAPSNLVTVEMEETIRAEIAEPILKAMAEEGIPFKGVLFIGLMLTYHGPRVLEFNARFGDPETQVMMPLLNEDLLPILLSAANGKLPERDRTRTKDAHAVCVIMASKGYPDQPEKGKIISLPDPLPSQDLVVFHAGTKKEKGSLVTSGGRVLGVTAWSASMEEAREHAYEAVKQTHFEGAYYRTDIGGKQ